MDKIHVRLRMHILTTRPNRKYLTSKCINTRWHSKQGKYLGLEAAIYCSNIIMIRKTTPHLENAKQKVQWLGFRKFKIKHGNPYSTLHYRKVLVQHRNVPATLME